MKTSYKTNKVKDYELTISLTPGEVIQLLEEFNQLSERTWVGELLDQIWDLAADVYEDMKRGD